MLRYGFSLSCIMSLCLVASNLSAQEKETTLNKVVVTANPFGRSADNLAHPVTILSGGDIAQNTGTTIGDVLGNEPGIRSSNYGPNISRPVIRGLDGDQINIMQNGINNLDASATSVDHNVAIDPLAVDRIEVIRGPAALLYGSKAVGGVVNLIDNRIPSEKIDAPITGIFDGRYNSANKERSAALLLEGGTEDFAVHLNGFARRTDDQRIPGFARSSQLRASDPLHAGEEEGRKRVDNSESETKGVTIGGSKFFDRGYVGVSYSRFDSEYGVVGDHEHGGGGDPEDVSIDMQQNRYDFAGLYKNPFPFIKDVHYKIGYSDYEHQEYEGDEVGTRFTNEGFDSRLEFKHDTLSGFQGIFGAQYSINDFEALGDEAFVPSTTTTNLSGFLLEERQFSNFDLNFGGRLDYQYIEKDGSTTFGNARARNDFTGSASAGIVYHLPQDYNLVASTTYTQRAPNAQELFSNGNHVATETFEVGNAGLDVQKSVGFDVGLRKTTGRTTGEVNMFYTYFDDFIALSPTGLTDGGSGNAIFNYENLAAEFYGLEAQARTNIFNDANKALDLEVRGDYLQARNRDTDDHLPRIAPARLGGSAIYTVDKVTMRLDTTYNFEQKDTAPNELSTDDFVMVDFGVNFNIPTKQTDTTLYIKATNLLDEEARNHVSFLKDQAPLAGRSVMLGLRSSF